MKRYAWQRQLEDPASKPSAGETLAAQLCLTRYAAERRKLLAEADNFSRQIGRLGTWAMVADATSFEEAGRLDTFLDNTNETPELPQMLHTVPSWIDQPNEYYTEARIIPGTPVSKVILTTNPEDLRRHFYYYEADSEQGRATRTDFTQDKNLQGEVGIDEMHGLVSLIWHGIERHFVKQEIDYRTHLREAGQAIQMPDFTIQAQEPLAVVFRA